MARYGTVGYGSGGGSREWQGDWHWSVPLGSTGAHVVRLRGSAYGIVAVRKCTGRQVNRPGYGRAPTAADAVCPRCAELAQRMKPPLPAAPEVTTTD